MSNDYTLTTAQVAALGNALDYVEHHAMNTLRRTDPAVQLLVEDEDDEPGTVHEAIADLITGLHEAYAVVAPLGLKPVYFEWEG